MCFFIFLFLVIFCFAIYPEISKQKTISLIKEAAKLCSQEHVDALVRQRKILVRRDAYGTENTTGWDKELDYFWQKILAVQIANALKNNVLFSHKLKDKEVKRTAIEEVNRYIAEASKETRFQSAAEVPTDPYEYEGYCRDLLELAGWKAWKTPDGRDQGADVVAEKKNVVVVLQCKKWNQPIGNKAVQEVVAAKALHSATVGIVVSNQPYTDSAQHLAAANNVLLLHHDELASLDSRLHL